MKTKKLFSAFLAAAIMFVSLPRGAVARDRRPENAVAMAGGEYYETLERAINSARSVEVVMLKDVQLAQPVTIEQGETVVLDMNGKTITARSGFSGRAFHNYGTLTIKGNGTIDASTAGAGGYGAVNNFGTLTVVDGTYTNNPDSNASVFYNRNGGKAEFHNPVVNGDAGCIATEANTTTNIYGGSYTDKYYPAIENRGNMLITAGTFVNTSCSSCDGRWGYTIRSGEKSSGAYLKIQGRAEDSVKVTGVQGGLSVTGGTADIYNGVYTTVPCAVHTSGSTAFYAGYFAGESYVTATNIYGGTFKSASRTGIMVGNGNPAPDSGAGLGSTVAIYGGTFIGGDAAKTAITVNEEQYAIGAAQIYAGAFSSDPEKFMGFGTQKTQTADGMYQISKLEEVTTDVETTVKVEDGVVVAEVGEEAMTDIISGAAASGTSKVDVTINAADESSKSEGFRVNIPASALEDLQKCNDLSLTIVGDGITCTVDSTAFKSIASQTTETTVSVSLAPDKNMTDAQKDAVGEYRAYEMLVDDGAITSFGGGKVKVTFDYTREKTQQQTQNGIQVWYVAEDGKVEKMPTTVEEADGKTLVTFVTDHFSTYAVGHADPATAPAPSYDWNSVLAAINALGGKGSIRVDVGSELSVPHFIWQAIYGKNITVTFVRGQDSFVVNGRTLGRNFNPNTGHMLTEFSATRTNPNTGVKL